MNFLKIIGCLNCLFLAFSECSLASNSFQGFVPIRNNKSIYAEYLKASPGKDTIVLLNGLTYSTSQYKLLSGVLRRMGFGVLLFDFQGMGQTLLKYAPSLAPYPVEDQVEDLLSLLHQLQITTPVHLVGLSYGGGIGSAFAIKYGAKIKSLILIAPYTEPLKKQDEWIRSQIWYVRQATPWNKATDDQLYDYFLKQIIYTTYPQAEPIVLENPFKLEAIYNLVRGIRKFRPIDQASYLPRGKVHLMLAGLDQYIPSDVLQNFWKKVSMAAKVSRINVVGSEHKIPEVFPEFTAKWIGQIVNGHPLIKAGRDFEGYPLLNKVFSGQDTIDL